MSNYYEYNFISPASLIAIVQEELKSYFDTGAVDNLLFPIYIDKCLQKLGRGSFPINIALLQIEDFQSRLPDDFFDIREAWSCQTHVESYRLPGSNYQEIKTTSIRLDTPDVYCDLCDECQYPDVIKAVYKTTAEAFAYYRRHALLKPGKFARNKPNIENPGAYGHDSFDIHGNKFTTTFRDGVVYILYYSKLFDDDGNPMVPDNFRILEFIELFIKYKLFEQLSNQSTDETYNQIQQKMIQYKALADEAYIIAQIESKKETIYDKRRRIIKTLHRNDKYRLK